MRSKILPKLVLSLALLTMCGCIGRTKHLAVPNGATGQEISGKGDVAFPKKDGTLEIGKYTPVPGDLIQRPRTQEEVIKALKDSGAKFSEPPK